jgi:hypothetical protein
MITPNSKRYDHRILMGRTIMQTRPFFNNLQGLYQGRQPPFHDVADIDGANQLAQAVDTIKNELLANLADPVRAAACFKRYSLKRQQGWRQIELMIYGVRYAKRLALFPKTEAVLNRIEGVSTAYFSFLSSHTTIPLHTGDTDAYYRLHLGISIPAPLPSCGFEVAGKQQSWETGKCFAFTDVYPHAAWNDTDQERIVLVVDILRSELLNQKLYVDAGARATLYCSRLHERFSIVIELLPGVVSQLLRPMFHLVTWGYHSFMATIRK